MNTNRHPMLDRFRAMDFDLALLLGDNIYADSTNMLVMEPKYRAMKDSPFWQALRCKARLMATLGDDGLGDDAAGADAPLREPSQKWFIDLRHEPDHIPH